MKSIFINALSFFLKHNARGNMHSITPSCNTEIKVIFILKIKLHSARGISVFLGKSHMVIFHLGKVCSAISNRMNEIEKDSEFEQKLEFLKNNF